MTKISGVHRVSSELRGRSILDGQGPTRVGGMTTDERRVPRTDQTVGRRKQGARRERK